MTLHHGELQPNCNPSCASPRRVRYERALGGNRDRLWRVMIWAGLKHDP